MYVRFTPKQLSKAKDFLKTASLKAWDIQIFSEIIKSLDNPIDEKIIMNKLNNGSSYKSEPKKKEYPKPYPKPVQKREKIQNSSVTNNQEWLDKEMHEDQPVAATRLREVDQVGNLDNAGIFGTIDSRTKKSTGEYI